MGVFNFYVVLHIIQNSSTCTQPGLYALFMIVKLRLSVFEETINKILFEILGQYSKEYPPGLR